MGQRVVAALKRLQGAPMAFIIRMGGRGLSFLMTIFLARLLGIYEYGRFAYAVAWATVLFIVADLGFQKVMVKLVAEHVSMGERQHLVGLVRFAHRVVLPFSLGIALVAGLIALLVVEPVFLAGVLIILIAVPLRGINMIWVGVLQGLRHPDLSFLPVFVVLPLGMMAIPGGLALAGVDLNANLAVASYVTVGAIIALVPFLLGRHFLRPIVRGANPLLEDRDWIRMVGPFTVVALLSALSAQAGLLLLGGLDDDPDSVGAFNVALRLGEPTLIALYAIAVTAAPGIAASHRGGELQRMRQIIRRAARTAFSWSLPVAVVFIVFHGWILGLFGPGFEAGGTAMVIVICAYLVNAFSATSDTALMMTGHLRYVVFARAAGLVVNIVVCLVLVPSLGATGAAVALAADTLTWNLALIAVVWKRLGVNCTPLPWPRGIR